MTTYQTWDNIDKYYDKLISEDLYPQPSDIQHTEKASQVIHNWFGKYKVADVLDVGCGEGFCEPIFREVGVYAYSGVCLGSDYVNALVQGRNVFPYDFNFLPYPDNTFELVFSRHSLEHSPFPIFSLMEWHRVATKYLCLIIPKPSFWGWAGRNHYSVMSLLQARFILARSGWQIITEDHTDDWEYRFLCGKLDAVSEELVEQINDWLGHSEGDVPEFQLHDPVVVEEVMA